ncbi:MAG: serine hydrolase [Clostridia bacterium]|nr:serine hydrolase [Clostridia bacterium]
MEQFFEKAKESGLQIINAAWITKAGCGKIITHPTPLNLYSVTKAFLALAVGFAVDENLLRLSDRIVALCPELREEAAPGAEEITVYHLLTMTHGHGTSILMPGQKERFTEKNYSAYFMRQPMVYSPGSRFIYCNGSSYTLGYVLQRVTGMSISAYLAPRLFAPLGIQEYSWETCRMGYETGGQGLLLKTEDTLKLGELFLKGGMGIVSPFWLKVMSQKHIDSDWNGEGTGGYGYQVWINRENRGFRAEGTMGQFVWIDEKRSFALAVNAKEPRCASGNEPFYEIVREFYERM